MDDTTQMADPYDEDMADAADAAEEDETMEIDETVESRETIEPEVPVTSANAVEPTDATERRELPLGDEKLSFETGRLARQADGSCVVRSGDTVVLVTATAEKGEADRRPFLPLTIDYREYAYAGGRIPGGFFKREGRPGEKETVTARLIDRPLRPLFPDGYYNETQIIGFVLSADGENDPDILALNGASLALGLSDIPFYNPIAAVRVGYLDGDFLINPSNALREVSELDLIVAGTREAVTMVEAAANQLPEETVLDAIEFAREEIERLLDVQAELVEVAGKEKPEWESPAPYSEELYDEIESAFGDELREALFTDGKLERRDASKEVRNRYLESIPEEDEDRREQVKRATKALEEEILRDVVLNDGRRFDDRALDEVRSLDIDVGTLPRVHGSAVFTRGETQALASITLGTGRDAQVVEEYEGESKQKFLFHYNFPPFSVGETKFLRGPGRREIGHGVLARRALTPLLPHEDDFGYTIRVVSDILESNGSSSMASVCGGSLALFDAGVPMLAPVAGIAMGLIKGEGGDDDYAILTDIAGAEDHFGDMDFKVAGTERGITALQMDIKIAGVTRDIMSAALEQAREARNFILESMNAVISGPRTDLSDFAPRLQQISIPVDKIRDVIGPGGKTIRSIIEETGCEIDVEQDGTVKVYAPNGVAAERAREMIDAVTAVPEVDKLYDGIVRRIEAYGAFVEILPNHDGLLHISELAPYHVDEVRDMLQEGDEVAVKVLDHDPSSGKTRLSRKEALSDLPDDHPEHERSELVTAGGGDDRDRDSGGGGGRGGRGRGGRGRR